MSVIVPVFNAELWIQDCLESLLNQTLVNIEIICINDGSKDGSLSILKTYEKRDKRIKIINQSNGGAAAARNTGIKIASGEYLAFVDADDWVDAVFCETLWMVAKKYKADVVTFNIDGSATGDIRWNSESPDREAARTELLRHLPGFTWNRIWRTVFWREHIHEFPLKTAPQEDHCVHWIGCLAAERFAHLNIAPYHYRMTGTSVSRNGGKQTIEVIHAYENIWETLLTVGRFEEFKTQLLKNKLESFRNLGVSIRPEFRSEFFQKIRENLGEDERKILVETKEVPWKIRVFHHALLGDRKCRLLEKFIEWRLYIKRKSASRRFSEPIRVLFVLGSGGYGGIERHVQCLISNINRSHVEPYLCVIRQPGAISDEIEETGVPLDVLYAPHGHSVKLLWQFLDIIRKNRIQLVHFHEQPIFCVLALWMYPRLPVIGSLHLALFGKVREWLWMMLLGRVNKWLAVSVYTLSRQAMWIRSKGQVFLNPISVPFGVLKDREWLAAEIGIPIGLPLIGMVGRMTDEKDWPAFLSICAEVAKIREDVHFVAVGDGILRSSLGACPEAAALTGRLHWMGFRTDAQQIIAALDVFLLTSKHEELPTTLLEAMAMKTPVAGFLPLGGASEVLACSGENEKIALLCDNREISQVVTDVVELLVDEKKGQCMAERAHRTVSIYFDARSSSRQLVELYRGMVFQ